MLGEELPPPLELRKKRSRSIRIMKKDSRSIKTVKLTFYCFLAFCVCYLNLLLSTTFRFLFRKLILPMKQKLSVGGTAEKIVSAFHLVINEHANEDEEMSKCKSAVHRVKKMENDVDVALTKGKESGC